MADALCSQIWTQIRFLQTEGYVDPAVQAMELSALPEIWKNGCELAELIAAWYVVVRSCCEPSIGIYLTYRCHSAQAHLQPHIARLSLSIVLHLERKLPAYVLPTAL